MPDTQAPHSSTSTTLMSSCAAGEDGLQLVVDQHRLAERRVLRRLLLAVDRDDEAALAAHDRREEPGRRVGVAHVAQDGGDGAVVVAGGVAAAAATTLACWAGSIRRAASRAISPALRWTSAMAASTRRKASTRLGSNCVPRQRSSSSRQSA